MDCTAIADRVAGYLDGELARSERTLFEAHLESCERCQTLIEKVSAVDLTPPPPVPATADPAFWASMEGALNTAHEAVAVEEANALPARPRGLRGLFQRELRVGLPVVIGYAALMLLTVAWALGNLQRAQRAEAVTTDLAQQLELEQRQNLAPQPTVPLKSTRTVSLRNKF